MAFAQSKGISLVSPEDLLVGRELERYHQIKNDPNFIIKNSFREKEIGKKRGTVGCVCKDQKGKYALAVSTGGTPLKLPGRVGDTPLWGSGGYANRNGAAAATGYGEDLIRILFTQRAVNYLSKGNSAQQAANKTISDLSHDVCGLGGIIVINEDGTFRF